MICCQEPVVFLKITEDPKMLSFIRILYIDTIILEIEMEKHLFINLL